MAKEQIPNKSVRIADETMEQFDALIKEYGWQNKDVGLRQLMKKHQYEEAKEKLPGLKGLIEDLQVHTEAIEDINLSILQHCENTEFRVEQLFKDKLESNQKIITTLQGKSETDKEEIERNQEAIAELTKQLEEVTEKYKVQKTTIETTEALCREYKEKLDQYEADREKQAELKEKLNQFAEQVQKLPELERKIEQQAKQHEENKKLLEQQAESERRMAILETKEEYNKLIADMKTESNQEYKGLLEQLEELRRKNYELEKSLLQKSVKPTRAKKEE